MSVNTKLAVQALSPIQAKASGKPDDTETLADRMSVGFEDLLDVVNPLQQLPVVSSVYREATGTDISIPARLVGGLLFGGPAGLVGSAAMVLFEEITGDSVLGHLERLIDGSGENAAPPATASTPLPWMKDSGETADAAPPSAASVAEALKRKVATTGVADTATLRPEERPAPQLLAKLYTLQATDSRGKDAIRP